MIESTSFETAMGDINIGFKIEDAKETLYQLLPLIGFFKLEEEKCADFYGVFAGHQHRKRARGLVNQESV